MKMIGGLRCPILKIEKSALFLCIYCLNSHLKRNFKSALGKKHQSFSLLGPPILCRT